MKKFVIAVAICLAVGIVASPTALANALLSFILLGTVPGTHITVPFWMLMAIYCGLIALIITDFVDTQLTRSQTRKPAKSQQHQMPRRRYSRI